MAGRSLDFDPLLSLLSYPPNKHYKLGIIEGGPPTHKFLRYFFSLIHKWNSSSIKQLFWNMLFWNCGNIAIWITDVKIINLNIFLHCVEKHTVLHFINYSIIILGHYVIMIFFSKRKIDISNFFLHCRALRIVLFFNSFERQKERWWWFEHRRIEDHYKVNQKYGTNDLFCLKMLCCWHISSWSTFWRKKY